MFHIHYYISSPDGILTVQIYIGPYLFYEFSFTRREAFHELVKALNQVDEEVNPESHSELKWKPAIIHAVIDALK
jgi:hypothetical protein